METKTLNIRGVSNATKTQLRLYAALTGLKQAEALGKALTVAISKEVQLKKHH